MKKMNKNGFTTVELIIVIAIVAVLAAVLIPTFANLINKANESVDIQLVRQMNEILAAEENISGKPENVNEVKDILKANGISNPTPTLETSLFYWNPETNEIILVDKNTKVCVFPEEYEDDPFVSTWLALEGNVIKTIGDLEAASLDEALTKLEIGQTLKLEKDATLTASTLANGTSIDLGGYTLTLGAFELGNNVSVDLSNGKIDAGGQMVLRDGSHLILNEVDLSVPSGIYLAEGSPEVIITGGSVSTPNYMAFSTNRDNSVYPVLKLTDVDITAMTGLMLNIPGEYSMIGGSITATRQCVFLRAGNGYFENVKMTLNNSEEWAETYNYYQPKKDDKGNPIKDASGNVIFDTIPNTEIYKNLSWETGNRAPVSHIVVGDFYWDYNDDAVCELNNVTFEGNVGNPNVYLSQDIVTVEDYGNETTKNNYAISHKAKLICDESKVTWFVNPGYAEGEGYYYSTSKVLYKFTVGNVFVNGAAKNAGDTNWNK